MMRWLEGLFLDIGLPVQFLIGFACGMIVAWLML